MDRMQSVYVCTFCQVFSSTVSSVANHIHSSHSELLPAGTLAEHFVSKLNALQSANNPKPILKRPKPKIGFSGKIESKEEKFEIKEVVPVPKPDGLFWCTKCHRSFQRDRQLVKHVCFDAEKQDNILGETSSDSDMTRNYKTHITIDPQPWSKRTKYKKREKIIPLVIAKNESENENVIEKASQEAVVNWRVDPSYLPVFQTEEEKVSFEKHVKSIDYSSVDILFGKKESPLTLSTVYFCKKCKKTAKSLSHMRMHCLIHTDLKPFTCPKCSYETNSKGSLYIHMRKHTGNMFHCSYCEFKSTKRVHVLDHEATHSSVPQICKLCQNTYKTLRSLIAHVKRYHNNSGGKKYIKSLSPGHKKMTIIHCSICQKEFASVSSFQTHCRMTHISVANLEPKDSVKSDSTEVISEDMSYPIISNGQFSESSDSASPNENLECGSTTNAKDPLAEDSLASLVLSNFFQENHLKPITFKGLYDQSEIKKMFAATVLLNTLKIESISEQLASLNETNQFDEPKSSDVVECDKTFAILNECLGSRRFDKECLGVNFSESTLPVECRQEFELPVVQPICPNESALQNHKVGNRKNNSAATSQLHQKFSIENEREEHNKSAEIKLFEKCHRAPAYVCCVCSAIFICSSTLKVHLKEHIDNSSNTLMDQEEEFNSKIPDACSELNNVCPMLIESTSSYSVGEKELEKLYTSCMDMTWYLPEVSVVLENDPALFDSVLDDISNFTDKYEEELNIKHSENSFGML